MPAGLLPRPRSLAPAAAAAIAAIAIGLAGCGGGSDSDSQDPAAIVPAKAPIYLEATLRPEGDQQANAKAVLGKLLNTADPARRLQETIDRSLKRSGEPLSYARDFDPWIGDRAAVAVTDADRRGEQQMLIAIDSRDNAKAESTLSRAKHDKTGTYKDVTYYVDDDTVVGLVGDHVVLGDLPAFRDAVDVEQGAAALSGAKGLKKIRGEVADDRVGLAYLDLARLADLARTRGESGALSSFNTLRETIAKSEDQQFGFALQAQRDALRLDGAILGTRKLTAKGDATAALEGAPADAWLGVGIGGVGATLKAALAQAAGGDQPGSLDPQVLLSQLKASVGIDLDRDLLSWMGDGVLYVRGAMLFDLNAALVVHSTNPARSEASVATIKRMLTMFGVKARTVSVAGTKGLEFDTDYGPLHIVAKGDRFVIAFGQDVASALQPPAKRLGDAPAFRQAAGRLREVKPSVFVDVPRALELFAPVLADNRTYRDHRDELESLGTLAGGGKAGSDAQHFEVAVGVAKPRAERSVPGEDSPGGSSSR